MKVNPMISPMDEVSLCCMTVITVQALPSATSRFTAYTPPAFYVILRQRKEISYLPCPDNGVRNTLVGFWAKIIKVGTRSSLFSAVP
jgi:hypothetical protein